MMQDPAYPTHSSAPGGSRIAASRVVRWTRANPLLATGTAIVVGLAVTAFVNQRAARRAERNNPPAGTFLTIDGCRLHYVDEGTGDPLLLLHGNGSMIQDFKSSGLMDALASRYRVLVFDRPGYGHSERPRTSNWSADRQADLIMAALRHLKITRAIVFGHSWGASVAVALALRQPDAVRRLVLASGYYYPTPRADAIILSGPALPVLGDILRFTIAPILGSLAWPRLLRKLFGPRPVPSKFADFPKEMALRPSQIRASAADAALLLPGALSHSAEYAALQMPVTIIAGDGDQLVNTDEQSARLHEEVRQSDFRRLAGEGHMIHQTATDSIIEAIDSIAARR